MFEEKEDANLDDVEAVFKDSEVSEDNIFSVLSCCNGFKESSDMFIKCLLLTS